MLGFVPPDQLKTGSPALYVGGILLGIVVLTLPPFLVRRRPRRPSTAQVGEASAAMGE